MLFSLQPCPSTFKNSSTTSYWPSGVVVSAAGVVTGPPSIKSRIYMNLHGVLLLNFWWDLLACMLGYIYLEPFACWKLYEEAVCYLVPEGDGTYLDLGRATVNRQMQPENQQLPTRSLWSLTKAFYCLHWPSVLVSAAGVATGPPSIKWSMGLLHRQIK